MIPVVIEKSTLNPRDWDGHLSGELMKIEFSEGNVMKLIL
jgi:hypothetical protein